jgi:two-component system, OmpR family, response regulator MprA
MRVLVVEDDPALADSLRRSMQFEGYETELTRSAEAAVAALHESAYDVVILDIGLPGVSGLELVRRMRREGDATAVLMLTARQMVGDRVAGLDAGADDYLVKPFDLEELLARIRALHRRSESASAPVVLTFEDLSLDRTTHEVRRGTRSLDLTHTEYHLLEQFLTNPRQVLSREQLWRRVWGYDFVPSSNSLDVFIGALRRKTEADGEPRLIHTVRRAGYCLRVGEQ